LGRQRLLRVGRLLLTTALTPPPLLQRPRLRREPRDRCLGIKLGRMLSCARQSRACTQSDATAKAALAQWSCCCCCCYGESALQVPHHCGCAAHCRLGQPPQLSMQSEVPGGEAASGDEGLTGEGTRARAWTASARPQCPPPRFNRATVPSPSAATSAPALQVAPTLA